MIYQEQKATIDNQISIAEYLASFWNPKAVEKAREMRNSSGTHKFKDDSEFEEHMLSGDYKDNPLLDAIKKLKEMDGKNNQLKKAIQKSPRRKLPTDLSNIQSILKKF